MTLLTLFITAALIAISGITLSNILLFPRLKRKNADKTPLVTVMIPARNEANVIADTLRCLRQQDYPNYEIILLDDHSDDGTGDIARAVMQGKDRFTVLQGQPLPAGWMGKNWACHQMQQHANGDYYVFTDADVVWAPGALSALMADVQHTNADLYSIWPTQETVTWGERLIVPLAMMAILAYLPIIGTHYVPMGGFGAANGQCMVWKRNAYHKIGGHKAVSNNVLEDVTLARMVKACGMRLRMADGNTLINCRMYTDWASVRDGFAKNILAGYGSVLALLLGTVFHLSVFIFPVVWLFTGWAIPSLQGWPEAPLLLTSMGILIRAITAAFTRQRVLDALLMPVSVVLMTRIAIQSIWWHYRYGGPKWKGRIIQKTSGKEQDPPSTVESSTVTHG